MWLSPLWPCGAICLGPHMPPPVAPVSCTKDGWPYKHAIVRGAAPTPLSHAAGADRHDMMLPLCFGTVFLTLCSWPFWGDHGDPSTQFSWVMQLPIIRYLNLRERVQLLIYIVLNYCQTEPQKENSEIRHINTAEIILLGGINVSLRIYEVFPISESPDSHVLSHWNFYC